MKTRFLGLSLALALTLSGCVTIYTSDYLKPSSDDQNTPSDDVNTFSDDLQTCTDANVATEDYIKEYVQVERMNPAVLPEVQSSFVELLRNLAKRDISPEFIDALMADAERLEGLTHYSKRGDRYTFCNRTFGNDY